MRDVIRKDSAVIDIIADIKATYPSATQCSIYTTRLGGVVHIKAKARVGLIQTATRRSWKGA
jgi:hypothetical protein